MFAIVWIGALMVSASLAYEHPIKRFKPIVIVAGRRQGYALPAQGYAVAPASEYAPSASYGVPAAPSGYGVPAAPSGYGVPAAYPVPSYPTYEYPEEEESKWHKFSGMIQKGIKGGVENVEKGIKGSMDKQKENMENMKGMIEGMAAMKKEKIQEFKDSIKEHLKSKKQKPVEENQSYAPAYPAPTYYAPAPVYSAPAYSAPAYSPPAYAAPAYPEPSYEAPAYMAQLADPEPSYLPSIQSSYPTAPISAVPFPLANPSAYTSSLSDDISGPANTGSLSYAQTSSYPRAPLPVPVPVPTPPSYSASPAVLLPAPSNFAPSAPSTDFAVGSAYGK
ncbi:adhesive plaque matrix protein [Daphnia magna]|uniref:Uncharacterized protein n=1 Tax=Daphnia magna TaxID=35525 RepID=A0ABQ9ZJD9_9CRUS|nr:adhesive plaque matrix protein [Daphnia magna]KAK4012534.1 hypothetical protein OUZ56_024773 [Daphnia magna]